jgi:hypothetical protein
MKTSNCVRTILKRRRASGAIAVHALENLAGSDVGIVRLRKLLSEQVKRVGAGQDPINIIRDPAQNVGIQTNAWNSVVRERELVAE